MCSGNTVPFFPITLFHSALWTEYHSGSLLPYESNRHNLATHIVKQLCSNVPTLPAVIEIGVTLTSAMSFARLFLSILTSSVFWISFVIATLQCNAMQCNAMQCNAMDLFGHCSIAMQCNALHCIVVLIICPAPGTEAAGWAGLSAHSPLWAFFMPSHKTKGPGGEGLTWPCPTFTWIFNSLCILNASSASGWKKPFRI